MDVRLTSTLMSITTEGYSRRKMWKTNLFALKLGPISNTSNLFSFLKNSNSRELEARRKRVQFFQGQSKKGSTTLKRLIFIKMVRILLKMSDSNQVFKRKGS
jgi:hypothetical protein